MKGLENYSFVVSSGIGVYMLRRETVSERVCDARRPQTPNTHAINSPATRMTIDNTRNFTTLIEMYLFTKTLNLLQKISLPYIKK